MPTYEYQCDSCRRVFEIRQRISDPPLATCDACGGAVRRLLSPAPFILKGGGWYVTDYPSESRKKALESEKSSEKSASAAGDTSSGGDKSPSGEKSPAGETSAAPTTKSSASTPAASASSSTPPSAD